MTKDTKSTIEVLFVLPLSFELSFFLSFPLPENFYHLKEEIGEKRLTFLNTVLFRPFMIRILFLGPHALGALFEMMLQRRTLSGVFTFC